MTIDINIVNGRLFLFDGFKEGGISIENNRIIKIGKEHNLPNASHIIDAKGSLVLPGLIDIHVHFRDLEQKYKETMETGTRSAIAGGVTTVLDMPNNKPETNSVKRLEAKREIINGKAAANIGFYSLIPEKISEIKPLAIAGVYGYKIYPASPIYPGKDEEKLVKSMQIISETNLPLIIHADIGNAKELETKYFESNMPRADAFLKAHNQLDEGIALENFIRINKELNIPLHCAHVTAKETIEQLEKNKENDQLTSEICPHHLYLTDQDLRKLGSEAKCLPPLRTNRDQEALWKALRDGLVNIITTDHAPHSYNEKHCEFEEAASGIHGLETLLPLMLTSAKKGMISFEELIPKMTSEPAKHAKILGRGELKEKNYADIVIVKKEKTHIKAEDFESKAKWTPFDGFETYFTPWYVLVNGNVAMEEHDVLSKARDGQILKRKSEVKIEEED
ncbi:MAG: dihydroorotase [Candidatus Heimdallarchaeota archaeon]